MEIVMKDLTKILRIDASARKSGSVSRGLADKVIDQFCSLGAIMVTRRDLSSGLPFVDEEWVGAKVTPDDQLSAAQNDALTFSDDLIDELKEADTIVIATPIYNFSIPASLKAWIDLIARAGQTFNYTENGPVGLLEGKRAVILVASGGTQIGSDIDFATPYLRHALKFIGITDVTVIAADALGKDAKEKIAEANEKITALKAA